MDFSIKVYEPNKGHKTDEAVSEDAIRVKTECLVVGVFEEKALSGIAKHLDILSNGMLGRLIECGEFDAKLGSTLILHEVVGWSAIRVLFVGLGSESDLNAKTFTTATRAAVRVLMMTRATDAFWCLTAVPFKERDTALVIRHTIITLHDGMYSFSEMKTKGEVTVPALRQVALMSSIVDLGIAQIGVKQGEAIAHGIKLTKDLGNLPSNVCTPTYLAEIAKKIAKDFPNLTAQILETEQIRALKMHSFLSVARGSVEMPRLIVLKYQGTGAEVSPIVLIGKGVTFDSGGISLKPGEGMDEMKYDMCGAGSVLGTMRAVAEMDLKLNVIAVIPATENMPSGMAIKPGDIVTSMSGQTIEVLNTDAEGRLILCDALTYAERFKPVAVIDIATLTGACVVALGHVNSGLFSKSDTLATELLVAGRQANDTVWRMPLDDEYHELLKSNFADMANIGGRYAGCVTAACFLSRFTEKYDWAHLDIAGTAWESGASKGATGRPVPLLTHFLIHRESR
ncbi:leucyl aminopeptidase [Candidatus Pandoraea novymonadis]|uniref:Probable cytosol aminopeptidase n=1 Tax=Candidatus Pandoraea novymonadis TaxID=1808959 RepID=A0ABX5FGA4_9BURK|nr:leucyl aminopeptidase [Candidatus Pandoraea novymonadis]PSB92247.1 Cytosol aminopeptidase [Candidatus Pandoraea novymonadis]